MTPHIRHSLDYMEPLKRGGIQGSNPLCGGSTTRSEGPGFLMEPSWSRHRDRYTPIVSYFCHFSH